MDKMLLQGEETTEMTDLQFYSIERDKRETELRQEVERLRQSQSACPGEGMTDFQFASYKEERDRRETELRQEVERLRQSQSACPGVGMTDFQFASYKEERDRREASERRNETLYQIVKSHAEAGKSSQEILSAIEALRGNFG